MERELTRVISAIKVAGLEDAGAWVASAESDITSMAVNSIIVDITHKVVKEYSKDWSLSEIDLGESQMYDRFAMKQASVVMLASGAAGECDKTIESDIAAAISCFCKVLHVKVMNADMSDVSVAVIFDVGVPMNAAGRTVDVARAIEVITTATNLPVSVASINTAVTECFYAMDRACAAALQGRGGYMVVWDLARGAAASVVSQAMVGSTMQAESSLVKDAVKRATKLIYDYFHMIRGRVRPLGRPGSSVSDIFNGMLYGEPP